MKVERGDEGERGDREEEPSLSHFFSSCRAPTAELEEALEALKTNDASVTYIR